MTKVRKIKCEFTNKNKQKVYILSDVLLHIGKLLKLDVYDLYNSSHHYNRWCKEKNYEKTDSTELSQIWFQEYLNAEDGMKACPPSVYLIDVFINDCPEIFPIEYIPDLEGHERCFDMDYLISSVQSNKDYQLKDKDGLLVKCLEKIKEVYGNEVYMVEQEV